MGGTTSKLEESKSSPTPVDQPGTFDITVSEELKNNMRGVKNTQPTSSTHPATDTTTAHHNIQLKRLPQLPDPALLQQAYDEGAQDMQARMDSEVERRVREQLSLRARVQQANEREAKARQEYENYDTRLNESLLNEDEKTAQLNTYMEALFDRQYSTPAQPLMCTTERNSCLECYKDAEKTTSLPIDCGSKIEAFVRCADGLREEFVSQGMPAKP
jgi:hypothetical protein